MNIQDYWAKSDTSKGVITLIAHTRHVSTAAQNLINSLPFADEERTFWLDKIIRCALLHDIGKIHKHFQEKLKTEKGNDIAIRHEIISLWLIETFLEKIPSEERFAIATHHKGVVNNEGYGRLDLDTLIESLRIHVENENLHFQKMPEFFKQWNQEFQTSFQIKEIENDLIDYKLPNETIQILTKQFQPKIVEPEKRFLLAQTRGLLIASDHIGSGRQEDNIPKFQKINLADFIPPVNKKTGKPFPFRNFQKKLQEVKGDVMLYAPTGSGKTEAALGWFYRNQVENARLFYLLPYTASINAMVIRLEKVFGKEQVTALHSKTLDFFYERLEKEDSNFKDNANIARSLKLLSREIFHPVKVATPHQILKNALFGKGWEMALFDYRNACFIIDEFHAYDALLTGLMLATIKWLKREFNAKVFFMSATIPEFLKNEIIKKVFNGNESIFRKPDIKIKSDAAVLDKKRHQLICEEDKDIRDEIDFINRLLGVGKSVLIIVNNVKTCQDLNNSIKFEGTRKLLHSGFHKMDRIKIEEDITHEDKSNRPQLLIATQAVEVSLDIDYEVAFIEKAPIDSLIQRFGRVNRAGSGAKPSPIYLFEKIIGNTPFYNDDVLQKTWDELLKLNKVDLSESDLVDTCNRVYKNGYNEVQQKDFDKGFANSTINNFKDELIAGDWISWIEDVIEDKNQKIDVLCGNLVEKYDNYKKEGDFIRANQLLVSVYRYETKEKYIKNQNSRKKGVIVANDLHYHKMIGYKKKVDVIENRFL